MNNLNDIIDMFEKEYGCYNSKYSNAKAAPYIKYKCDDY